METLLWFEHDGNTPSLPLAQIRVMKHRKFSRYVVNSASVEFQPLNRVSTSEVKTCRDRNAIMVCVGSSPIAEITWSKDMWKHGFDGRVVKAYEYKSWDPGSIPGRSKFSLTISHPNALCGNPQIEVLYTTFWKIRSGWGSIWSFLNFLPGFEEFSKNNRFKLALLYWWFQNHFTSNHRKEITFKI